jgi:hypothetical protein
MMMPLRGKNLDDEAVFRLCDAITSARGDSALITQLRSLDLRDNNLTDDAATYLLPLLANDRLALTSVLLDGNTSVTDAAMTRAAKASSRKKVALQLANPAQFNSSAAKSSASESKSFDRRDPAAIDPRDEEDDAYELAYPHPAERQRALLRGRVREQGVPRDAARAHRPSLIADGDDY